LLPEFREELHHSLTLRCIGQPAAAGAKIIGHVLGFVGAGDRDSDGSSRYDQARLSR
jgi:hypothetical protein